MHRGGSQLRINETSRRWSARAVKSAHEYQRRAEECRQRADHAVHPDDKAGWLQAAQDWNNLALYVGQTAEERGLAAALSVAQGTQWKSRDVEH
jgi:hypothetical protein